MYNGNIVGDMEGNKMSTIPIISSTSPTVNNQFQLEKILLEEMDKAVQKSPKHKIEAPKIILSNTYRAKGVLNIQIPKPM